MKGVLQFHSYKHKWIEKDRKETTSNFQQLFATEMTDFFHLSLCLTADVEMAESCLSLAMGECFGDDCIISDEWARIRARRKLVRHAIRLVLGTGNTSPDVIHSEAEFDPPLQPNEDRDNALRESSSILELPNFERLVFVICEVEHYSTVDCALLLKQTPTIVTSTRMRAVNHLIALEERNRLESAVRISNGKCDTLRNGVRDFNGSSGSLLD